jgi:hypothetical protein
MDLKRRFLAYLLLGRGRRDRAQPCEKTPSFSTPSFSDVFPEPVLATMIMFSIKRAQKKGEAFFAPRTNCARVTERPIGTAERPHTSGTGTETCEKRSLFSISFPLPCLSRACLGKKIVFRSMKTAVQEGVFFRTGPITNALSCASAKLIRRRSRRNGWLRSPGSTSVRATVPISNGRSQACASSSGTIFRPEKPVCLSSLPYVCPKPVLVK